MVITKHITTTIITNVLIYLIQLKLKKFWLRFFSRTLKFRFQLFQLSMCSRMVERQYTSTAIASASITTLLTAKHVGVATDTIANVEPYFGRLTATSLEAL